MMANGWNLEATYLRLPTEFHDRAKPARFPRAELVIWNAPLAAQLGFQFQATSEEQLAELFAGQELPPGATPFAQAYAGHQYGGFTMLGDGRAIVLGEQLTPSGQRFDIQLKGPGPTRYSRRGDGLAALGPMLREFLISEAMHALGIPTTRSLAVVRTGERVYRDRVLPGAILTRVASSHLRVGTFEYASALRKPELLRTLMDYAITRHDPELLTKFPAVADRAREFLRAVLRRQAGLIARWMTVGFVHGVMNTDNVAISGETIDYGPCAFLDVYHPKMVFSSIDDGGRYAFSNQPTITHWNLARFAESLLAVLDDSPERAVEIATEVLNEFPEEFRTAWLEGMRAKLGLNRIEAADAELITELMTWMTSSQADFTNTFDDLAFPERLSTAPYQEAPFQAWLAKWQERRLQEEVSPEELQARMLAANPGVIPRNHRVEEALSAAETNDMRPFQRLLSAVQSPFARSAKSAWLREPPPATAPRYRTFCGT
ncbi:MAG: protein adenylyltransferase SelO [Gemmataceae bacterium]